MNKRVEQYVEGLFVPYSSSWNERTFVSLVYAWFVFFAFWNWHSVWLIWGEDSVCIRYGAGDSRLNNLVYALMYNLSWFKPVFIFHLVVSFFSIFHFRWVFLFRGLAWLSALWIYYAGINAMNAGYVFMMLLMFFCIPFSSKAAKPFWAFLSRLSLLAAGIQVGLIYFYTSMYKLTSWQWLSGEAIYQTFVSDWFSNETIRGVAHVMPYFISVIFAYIIMLFQFTFPIIINWKRTRKFAVILGVSIHLYIGIFMHMWDFALAMMVPYTLFTHRDDRRSRMTLRED
jgi:hypothetical protein